MKHTNEPSRHQLFSSMLGLVVAAASLTAPALACSSDGGYDRASWANVLLNDYRLEPSSVTCLLDGVEENGLEEKFAGTTVEIDFELERVIRTCDMPGDDQFKLGVFP